MTDTTQAAVWTLDVPASVNAESNTVDDTRKNPGTESVFYDDTRQAVDPIDFYDGGKYRCKSP